MDYPTAGQRLAQACPLPALPFLLYETEEFVEAKDDRRGVASVNAMLQNANATAIWLLLNANTSAYSIKR